MEDFKMKSLMFLVLAFACITGEAFATGFSSFAVNVNNGSNVRVKSVNRGGLFRRNVNKVKVRSNNNFSRGNQINVFAAGVPSTTINGRRVNVFGTRTIVDGNGNVFEIDAFGNKRFRGNTFNRGFSSFSRSFSGPSLQVFSLSPSCSGF
jgi:hypothetical protein